MDRAYVSEFTLFMNHYLEQHPEVVEAQQRGWRSSWQPEIDPAAWREPGPDLATDAASRFNRFTRRAPPRRPVGPD